MSVRYEAREVKRPKLIQEKLVEATCDRCGANAMFKGGTIGNAAPIWCVTGHFIQGDGGRREQHELCLDCSGDLLAWIKDGKP